MKKDVFNPDSIKSRQIAAFMLDILEKGQRAETITATNPITTREICTRYQNHIGEKVAERVVRGLVHYLIVTRRIRIGSTSQGYWLMAPGENSEHTLNQIASRITEMLDRLAVLDKDFTVGFMNREVVRVRGDIAQGALSLD